LISATITGNILPALQASNLYATDIIGD